VTYVWPALVVCVLAGATAAGAVMLVRGAWLIRLYRQPRNAGRPSAPTSSSAASSIPASSPSVRVPGPAHGR
jgi:hypothetical protein